MRSFTSPGRGPSTGSDHCSDPDHARRWAKSLGRSFVYKPLGGAFHTEGGSAKIVYTTPLDDPDELNDPAISLTAHMFQE
ncbi:MAG: hypothetical protein ACRDK0_13495, partial [Solirubrobacteraceae bacterium]